jgi:2-polyprenyl-6-methoxyphenol hydroxylase-like FAD-dependent oxidoreductase
VGAGPAGAATAILLAQQELSVVLLDRARFPRDKVCGEYLSPEGTRILDRLGVLDAVESQGARPLRGMRILAPDGTLLVGDYPTEGPWRGYRPHALAVRRRVLDATLVERARAVGVVVREGIRVVDLLREGRRIAGVVAEPVGAGARASERLAARVVIAADGRASVIVERLGFRRRHRWLRRLALVADVEGAAGDPERGEIVIVPPAYGILNPVAAGVANLSLVISVGEGRRHKEDLAGYFDAATRALPGLGERLRHAVVSDRSGRWVPSPTKWRHRATQESSWSAMPLASWIGSVHGRGDLRRAPVGGARRERRRARHPVGRCVGRGAPVGAHPPRRGIRREDTRHSAAPASDRPARPPRGDRPRAGAPTAPPRATHGRPRRLRPAPRPARAAVPLRAPPATPAGSGEGPRDSLGSGP